MGSPVGRYRDVSRSPMPGDHLPPAGKFGTHGFIEHGSVADPNPSLRGKRQRVAINVKTDALEREHANGRISEAGYWAARTFGAVLERSRPGVSGAGAWNPGNRVDQVISHELAILGRICRSTEAVEMMKETAPLLGMRSQRLLELVLVDGLTIGDAGARICGGGKARQDVIFWATLFRRSCEDLADYWCGRRGRAPRVLS